MEGLFLTRVADVDCAAGRSIEGRFRRALQFLVILQFLQQASNFQGPPCNAKLGVNFLLAYKRISDGEHDYHILRANSVEDLQSP